MLNYLFKYCELGTSVFQTLGLCEGEKTQEGHKAVQINAELLKIGFTVRCIDMCTRTKCSPIISYNFMISAINQQIDTERFLMSSILLFPEGNLQIIIRK